MGPLDTLNKLILTKDKSYFNQSFFLTAILNFIFQGTYNLLISNYKFVLPNFIGVVLVLQTTASFFHAHGYLERNHPMMAGAEALNNSYSFLRDRLLDKSNGYSEADTRTETGKDLSRRV